MSEPTPPSTLIRRALRLRCPRCGQGRVLQTWITLKERCPACDLALERGEQNDYWIGALTINLVMGELCAVLITLPVLLRMWPRVGVALWLGISLAIIMPFVLYPFARMLWLAVDLAVRPHEPGDDRRPT